MSLRIALRSPFGDRVVREVSDGRWAEAPTGAPSPLLGDDLWALPGLVDGHAHLAAEELDYQPGDFDGAMVRARAALAAGVTLLLDKGWTDDVTIRVIDALPAGERPEIEAAARVLSAPNGYFPGFAKEVEPGDIEKAVADEASAGAGWVKLIGDWPRKGLGPVANFSESELRRAAKVAESMGARVAIHTMARDVPSMAVAAGVHSIEHGMFLTETDIAALGERGGMWVPTLRRNEATLAQLGAESSGGRLFLEGLARIENGLLPMAVEAGVRVLAGTDLAGSPADVAAEAKRLGEYGLGNADVVAAVSLNGFVATERDHDFSIGSAADAVLFAANPIDDVEVLAHPAHVMRHGRML